MGFIWSTEATQKSQDVSLEECTQLGEHGGEEGCERIRTQHQTRCKVEKLTVAFEG